jgi:hypothetical protein
MVEEGIHLDPRRLHHEISKQGEANEERRDLLRFAAQASNHLLTSYAYALLRKMRATSMKLAASGVEDLDAMTRKGPFEAHMLSHIVYSPKLNCPRFL